MSKCCVEYWNWLDAVMSTYINVKLKIGIMHDGISKRDSVSDREIARAYLECDSFATYR